MSNKNELVVKSNRLIEASYRLTLAEQRIVLFAIAEARRTGRGLSADDFVEILAADYAEMFDVPLKQAYEQIKDAAKTLFRRYVVLYGENWTTEARWLSSVGYHDGKGRIRLRFAPEMVPFITRLEVQFTRYKLEKVAKMNSAYAIRLYELLIQWGSVGTREIELEWLKKTLMVDKDYPRLFDFKKWVLDVALSQINEHSDLVASYAQRKTGRNVTHLTFTFAPKEEAAPEEASPSRADDAPVDIRTSALFQRLRGHGIGAKLAAAWIRQDEARALATVEYVEARAKAGQVKGSAAGYLRSLFEGGAEVGPSAFEAGLAAQAREAAESARRGKRQESEARRAEAEKRKQEQDATDRAMAWFGALPEDAQNTLEAEYLTESKGIDAGLFKKKGRGYTGFRIFVKQKWASPTASKLAWPAQQARRQVDMSWLDEPE